MSIIDPASHKNRGRPQRNTVKYRNTHQTVNKIILKFCFFLYIHMPQCIFSRTPHQSPLMAKSTAPADIFWESIRAGDDFHIFINDFSIMSTATSCASCHLGPESSPLMVRCPSASPSIYRCLALKSVSIWHRVHTDGFVNIRTNMSVRSSAHTHMISPRHTRSLPLLVSRWLWGHKVPSDSISTKVIPPLQRRITRLSSAFLLKHNSPHLAFWHHISSLLLSHPYRSFLSLYLAKTQP